MVMPAPYTRQPGSISTISAARPARCSAIASDMPEMPPPTIRTRRTPLIAPGAAPASRRRSVPPALLPLPFADGTGDARVGGRGRHRARRRHQARDLEHELGADRFLEL